MNLGTKLCDILPENSKKAESLQEFKNKIKLWTPLNCIYVAEVLSFMWFQFPNPLNFTMYRSSTSLMVWYNYLLIGISVIYICKALFQF